MSIFSKLFGPKQDPLFNQANTLVPAACITATNLFVPLLDKFPFLRDCNVEHWDFIVTVAGVFIGSSRLNNMRIGEDREDRLMETVAKALTNWNSDGIRAFEDCKQLYENEYDRLASSGHDKRFIASDAVGKWIVWNVLGRAPRSPAEASLIRTSGALVINAFFNWWKE